jgi:uncharacterized protein
MHTAPYFTAIGLLTILHAGAIVRLRRKHRVGLGDGGIPELETAIRIFGNHIEYAPLGLILLIALEFVQATPWYMHAVGTSLLLGRVLHAHGLRKSRGVSAGRTAGMILTFASLALASVGITIYSMMTLAN